MSLRILVVDDSQFFQHRLIRLLKHDTEFEVVGTAVNGLEAVLQSERLRPDLITMDVEMPLMDGIGATRRIMARHPTIILMLSALTRQDAAVTLDALDAGAFDYIPKSRVNEAMASPAGAGEFCRSLRRLLEHKPRRRSVTPPAERPPRNTYPLLDRKLAQHPPVTVSHGLDWSRYRLLLIGASTGGPPALAEVIRSLPGDLPVPVVLIQHMPPAFTEAFAERLDALGPLNVAEAHDGERLVQGKVRLAPGGQHLRIARAADGGLLLKLSDPQSGDLYHPSIDHAFNSAAEVVGGQVLCMVLTGMGRDGTDGCRQLRQCGAEVWAEAESSCVVYGMSRSVVEAGLAQRELALPEMLALLRGGRA